MSGIITTSGQTISGTIGSGETITGGTVPFQENLDVLSGGAIINTDIGGLDNIYIQSGGLANETTFTAGGAGDSAIYVYAGATISQTTFLAFGDQEIIAGGVASGSTLLSPLGSGVQNVETGGVVYDTDILGGNINEEGNQQIIESGGSAYATTIGGFCDQFIDKGGLASQDYISSDGYVEVESGATLTGTTDFTGAGGTLALDLGSDFSGTTIDGFETVGNQIDLKGTTYSSNSSASLGLNNLLTVTEGTVVEKIQFDPSQDFGGDTFHLAPLSGPGPGSVKITLTPCFAAGTRILTPRGEVAVEALEIGDEVITDSGDDAAIKWIGTRRLDLSRHPAPEKAQPILFEPDCFADGVPRRNLILSPDHALYVDGYLVPAKALVNDRNIRQLNQKTVIYYHIELAEHSIIFAENTAVESYLETGNRGAFQNAEGALTLHPDFAQTMREQNGCAPFAEAGPVVEAARMLAMEQFYTLAAVDRRRRCSRS